MSLTEAHIRLAPGSVMVDWPKARAEAVKKRVAVRSNLLEGIAIIVLYSGYRGKRNNWETE
jgi:trehalose utilization protein